MVAPKGFRRFYRSCYCVFRIFSYYILSVLIIRYCLHKLINIPKETDNLENVISCYYLKHNDGKYLTPLDGMSDNIKKRSIFFIETSCKGGLNSRQACSIESAIRANPKQTINVLMTGPICMKNPMTKNVVLLQTEFKVKFWRVNITEYFEGTPLENMIDIFLNKSIYRVHHASDLMRYLTLYKYGGIYLDLDIIVAKSFENLPENWAAMQDGKRVAAGAIAMGDEKIGKRVAAEVINELRVNSNPFLWSHHSVDVLTRSLQKICNISEHNMSAITCQGFEIFHSKYFYPINYTSWDSYFKRTEISDSPYTYHVWNYLSKNKKVPHDSLFAKLAEKYCPTIFENYGENFGA